jgi:hypothetical protein
MSAPAKQQHEPEVAAAMEDEDEQFESFVKESTRMIELVNLISDISQDAPSDLDKELLMLVSVLPNRAIN